MAEGSPLGAPLGSAFQEATSHEDIPPPQEWEGCRRPDSLASKKDPCQGPFQLQSLSQDSEVTVPAVSQPKSSLFLVLLPSFLSPPPPFFYFGHDVQQLDVGSQFPDQGLNLGRSSESANS